MAQDGNISRTWFEWVREHDQHTLVLVIETNLQTDPTSPDYNQAALDKMANDALENAVGKFENTAAQSLQCRVRVIPKHQS